MGYNVKATNDKVKALTSKKGKFSIKKFAEIARASPSYSEMKTLGSVNKQTMMFNICREMNEKMLNPMLQEVVSMYATLFEGMSQEIKRLNNELSGTEEMAPKNEAEDRYIYDREILHEHVEKIDRFEKQLKKCEKMARVQNEKIFGSFGESSDDDDGESKTAEFDSKEIETLKTIKEHGKSIEIQMDNTKHSLYKQASNGLYSKASKNGTSEKAPFPKGAAQMKKKEFIAKVKQYLEYRPEQFSYILPEARRSMDDYSRRTGVHFDPGTWDEQEEKMRDEFRQQNDRLYKMFEINLTQKEFTAAQSQYTFGLSGLVKTKGKCEKGDGLRVLHYFLSTLSKVSTQKIEEVETDLQCLPVMFGTGGVKQIQEAVAAAEELLERGEEMECVVQYKTVLRICQVLTKKNPLFVRLHEEYLRASVVAERRNSISDLRSLMGDIKEVCEKICGAGDETRSVKVNLGMKVFSVSELGARETKDSHMKEGPINVEKDTKRKWVGGERQQYGWDGQKQQNEKKQLSVNLAQESPVCRHDRCNEKAFRHKKERGGHVHESRMCFEHFVHGVRDGKKEKPEGVPLKGGKKMVLKRGEGLKWTFKILSVKAEEEDEGPIQKMLKMERDGGGEEERVFSTFVRDHSIVQQSLRKMIAESEGGFDLADLEGSRYEKQEGEIESYEGGGGEQYPVMSNVQ